MDTEGHAKLNDYVAKFMAAASGSPQPHPTQPAGPEESTQIPERLKEATTTDSASGDWSPASKITF
jgi:hypothetical protein